MASKAGEKEAMSSTPESVVSAVAAPVAPTVTASVEVYPIREPYSYASIVRDSVTNQLKYLVVEPVLSEDEKKILARISDLLIDELDVNLNEIETREKAERFFEEKVERIIKKYKLIIDESILSKIMYFLVRDFIYYGKIDPFMRDAMIEDVSCNGVGIPIYLWHRRYESIPTNVLFDTTSELNNFIIKLAYLSGRHISVATPLVDSSFPDGSRVQMSYGTEVTKRGSTFTIRKFKADPLTIVDLIGFNTLSADMASYIWFGVEHKRSIMVSGGIACGKTTLLNALSMFIKPDMKIVSIEDTPEINLPHENWIQSVTRTGFGLSSKEAGGTADVNLFDLLRAAVRQRPDYIIVGEVRGAEAYTLFQAMSTGHLGFCTVHSDSVDSVIHRLESEPMNIPRSLITGMDLITIQARTQVNEKPARRTMVATEMVGMDPRTQEILTNDVYRWNSVDDSYYFTGRSYMLEKIAREMGLRESEVHEELRKRKTVLNWMVKNKIRRYVDVSNIIRQYYSSPEKMYRKAESGYA